MSNADKIKAALERIEQGLATINTDEDWISFLRFQSLFYQYSFGNTIMIFYRIQKLPMSWAIRHGISWEGM